MKIPDRPKAMHPMGSILVPLLILFVSSLNGPTVADALHHSWNLFFSKGTGIVLWAEVLVLNLLLYAWFAPVFFIHMRCLKSCEPPIDKIDLGLRRLNGLYPFSIAVSILVFALGRMALFALDRQGLAVPTDWAPAGRGLVLFMEAAANGFFVGVIIALQYESRLFRARATILSHRPREKTGYSSLFSKVFLILIALVLFMTVQSFSFAGSFFALGGLGAGEAAFGEPSFLTAPELIFKARHSAEFTGAINVFGFRMLILGLFVVQMLYQLKMLIKRPLAVVLDRLETLNSPDPGSIKAVEIVQNDEFAAVYREINELIAKQQGRLELSRRRLEGVVASAANPIIAYDAQRVIRLFNPAAEALFGVPRGEAIGKDLGGLFGCFADELERAGAKDMVAASSLGEPGSGGDEGAKSGIGGCGPGCDRVEWLKPGGEKVILEAHFSETSGEGEAWTTVILHDVTKQAEFAETLKRAKGEAENSSRMKSEFLANMSHELRTPLNAILGFTQLLENDRNLTGTQQERIRVISRSGEHLLALINDILDISKIEAGKMELHLSVFDLPEFVGDLRDMFELKCRKKNLSLYVDSLEGLPRYVRGDMGKLRQVLVNLLGNAVKFTAEGGIGVLVGRDGDLIRFSVRDTGRGIPKEEQEAILLPFVQASTTDHEGGTGLGLAISSRYIAMLGGSLSVESSPGQGSVFSFSIPLEPSGEAPESHDDEETMISVEPGREVTVLVVDDQDANRLVLKEMLERAGFSAIEAGNGREAIDRAREFHPAIVFMDIKMPVMDGYAAVAELKSDPATAGIRVFALTASAFSHDETRIAEAGFDGFLAKPFKQGTLFRLIRDKGGVPLRLYRAPEGRGSRESESQAGPDFAEAAQALGAADLAAIEEAALINDFASLAGIASGIASAAPSFAAALAEAAGAYDEGAIAALIAGLKAAGGRTGDGR